MLVISITNQKGGVGKTTTTYHLARAASRRNLRTLVIDLDPQGNLSDSLTELEEKQAGMADVLSASSSYCLDEVVVETAWNGVYLAPSGGDALAVVRNELITSGPGREMRLAEALRRLDGAPFDLVLIDCAPALDALTTNAFTAADGVLVVTQSRLYSATGLAHLLDAVEAVRAYYNPCLSVVGVLVNQHRANTSQGRHWNSELASACQARGLALLDPPVPDRVAISDSSEAGVGLDDWPGAPAELVDVYDSHLAAVVAALGGVGA
jgi:chromosome partitioning protein